MNPLRHRPGRETLFEKIEHMKQDNNNHHKQSKPATPSTRIPRAPINDDPARDSLHPLPGETALNYWAFIKHLDAWCDLMIDLSRLGLHPRPEVISMLKPLPPHLHEISVQFKWNGRLLEWMGWFKKLLYLELNRGLDEPGFEWPGEAKEPRAKLLPTLPNPPPHSTN